MPAPAAVTTPAEYIAAIDDDGRRAQIAQLDRLIRDTLPDLDAHVRSGMLGYGSYAYRYASGREGEWFQIGLASNKRYISLYVICTIDGEYLAGAYADRLGTVSVGKSCIRFKRVEDVDLAVLTEMLEKVGDNPPPAV